MVSDERYYELLLEELGKDVEAMQALPPAEALYELGRALGERGVHVDEVSAWIEACEGAEASDEGREECFVRRARAATREPARPAVVYALAGIVGLGVTLTASYLLDR